MNVVDIFPKRIISKEELKHKTLWEIFNDEVKDMVMSGLVYEFINKDGEMSLGLTVQGMKYAKKMYMLSPEEEKRWNNLNRKESK
jgi:hypothetical protein